MLTTLMMLGLILVMVATLMQYAGQSRRRATELAKGHDRDECLQSGLQLARSYFGRNFINWNTYLSSPQIYNPVATPSSGQSLGQTLSAFNPTPSTPKAASLLASNPELFADLDGDSAMDVYIYIRDNEDEFPPATANWQRDNDQNVVVGAMCISSTLVPRAAGVTYPTDGGLASDTMIVEAVLSYNNQSTPYAAQSSHGVSGSGNMN